MRTWCGRSRVTDGWVVDTSPVIALGRIQCLDLLPGMGSSVLIPEAVLCELEAGLTKEPGRKAILAWARAFRVRDAPIATSVAGWDLGAGESQVIALCLSDRSRRCVLDDGEARRCALSLGVPMTGTLGILLRAKRMGMVPRVRPLIERLAVSGYYLDRPLIERVLERAGE